MQFKGFTLDKFQEDAISAINENKSVVVSAPTGSGKTLIADYIIDRDVKRGEKVIYTAPIKALSNQKYKEFSKDFGESNVGLITGDVVINHSAPVLIMTTEIYRNMVITKDPMVKEVNYVILDEIHFINDIERGTVWEESIIFAPKNVRFLCLSATIPNAQEFASWIQAIKGHPVATIRHDHRYVPLHHQFYDSQMGISTLEEIRDVAGIPEYGRRGKRMSKQRVPPPNHVDLIAQIRDKTPCICFTFSRVACQKKAAELSVKKFFKEDPAISTYVRDRLEQASPEIRKLPTTILLRRVLPMGIGFHHAGLLPVLKEIVEHLFAEGKIRVLYATETFAVGINMPAKTVVFDSPEKYDGTGFRYMNTKEYFQMAGRAGRRGIDKVGYAITMLHRPNFDYARMKRLTDKDVLPIKSQFKLSINTVLNLISRHTKLEIGVILKQSFDSYQKYGPKFDARMKHAPHHTFQNMKKKLEKMGYVQNDMLTKKGTFASKIFSDELTTSEIFATDIWRKLNEYQTMLVLGAIVYEFNDRDRFVKQTTEGGLKEVYNIIKNNNFLRMDERFHHLKKLSALLYPCYKGEDFFEILKDTTLLEGDLIRFLRQMLDRINQITKAADDYDLTDLMKKCRFHLDNCMKDIEVI